MARVTTARTKATKATKSATSAPRAPRVRRAPRLKIEDLHDPTLDPKGRVDVLVARGIKLMVKATPNPVVQTLYENVQPILDAELQRLLKGFNIGELMGGGLKGPAKGKRT